RPQKIKSYDRQYQLDLLKKELHVSDIRFRERFSAGLCSICKVCSTCLFGKFHQPAFEIANMSLGDVLVLRRNEAHLCPEILRFVFCVSFDPIGYAIALTYIDFLLCGFFRILTHEEINTCSARLLTFERVTNVLSWGNQDVTGPVHNFGGY